VLQGLKDEIMRSDFLAGNNGAVCITKEDMDILDELSQHLFPQRSTNADDTVSGAALLMVNLLDKKKKEWTLNKTFAEIFDLVMTINSCDYFKNIKNSMKAAPTTTTITTPTAAIVQEPEQEEIVVELEDTLIDPAIIKKEISGSPSLKALPPSPQMAPHPAVEAPLMAPPAEAQFFVAQQPNAQHFVPPPQQPQPVHLPPRQTISDVIGQGNSAFDFLQESQIEAEAPPPVMMGQFPPGMAPPTAPAASSVPQPDFHQVIPPAAIPSQTFTNQTFQVRFL
jgi:hypothetical protein